MAIVTVNAGSSSIRLGAYIREDGCPRIGASHHGDAAGGSEAAVLRRFLADSGIDEVSAVAHRVVHGGSLAPGPHRIDAALEAVIESFTPLAPLHNPAALAWIHACRAQLPRCPQFAVFDTAFFHALPAVARSYALPADITAHHGLRRYGFHGIAHEAMWRHWLRQGRPGKRVISLQLGAGCSIAAIRDGRAIDTSMGFSPLEGLVMATRGGDVDPGALLHLLREGAMSAAELEEMLNRRSGLLGLSGISGDMRTLLASDRDAARHAIDLYVYRARKYLGAFLAALGGADAIVFGGGVGEHSAPIRAAIVDGLQWAGVRLDAAANRRATGGAAAISTGDSLVAVHVVAVDEAAILADAAASALVSAHTKENVS